ncbi:unnamed protein product [Cylicocyclus nassatus]|uniref:Uncharacterized protein n=1 Tax=Cylicocyclus nassatus TaxID=53992 RepID=A0AA36M1T6_CYLNA|nr:unnamed protein product [Cylicocyclus nassatus]
MVFFCAHSRESSSDSENEVEEERICGIPPKLFDAIEDGFSKLEKDVYGNNFADHNEVDEEEEEQITLTDCDVYDEARMLAKRNCSEPIECKGFACASRKWRHIRGKLPTYYRKAAFQLASDPLEVWKASVSEDKESQLVSNPTISAAGACAHAKCPKRKVAVVCILKPWILDNEETTNSLDYSS